MARSIVAMSGLLLLAACTNGGLPQDPCGDGTLDCFNLDRVIDRGEVEDIDPTVVSTDAHMCVANEGRVYAVWIDDRGNFKDVWFAFSGDEGKTWERPARVKQGSGDATGVDLACAGDRVFVAWQDTRQSETDYENIFFQASNDGGQSWLDDDLELDDDPEGRSISLGPKIVFRGASVHVVWFDQKNGAPDVFIASSLNGGQAFGEPVRVSASEEERGDYWSGNPEVAVDGQGRVHIVWEDTRNGGQSADPSRGAQDIYHARVSVSETGTEVTPATRLTRGEPAGKTFGFAPKIATDGNEVWVVWHDTRGGDARDIFMNYSGNGGNEWLSAAVRVESDAAGAAESLNADIVAGGGTAHVVWQDKRNGGYDIYYRSASGDQLEERSAAGGTYYTLESDEEVRVDTDPLGAGNSLEPRIILADETLLVAWKDLRASGEGLNDLYYNYKSLGEDGPASWARSDLRLDSVFSGTKYTQDLSIGLANEVVYAMWIDNRDGRDANDVEDLDVLFSASVLGEGVDLYESIPGIESL